jgi:anti-repressor protein
MNTEIQRFDFKGAALRTLTDENGEPWFVAKDVCDVLGYTNASKAISDHVDSEDKLNNESLSSLGQRGGWLVNESGLYSLVFSSKLPTAKEFKRWVTHEVLPQIRKHGAYMTKQTLDKALTSPDFLIQLATELKNEQEKVKELEPKARFADAVAASDGTCLIGELAKMLRQNGFDTGQNRLFEILRQDGYLGRTGSNRNVPTQRAMDLGLFRIKETAVTHSDGHVTINRTAKVTGKGQTYFVDRYCTKKD